MVAAALVGLCGDVTGALPMPTGLAMAATTLDGEVVTQDRELARGSWHDLLSKYRRMLHVEDGTRATDGHFLLGRVYARLGLAAAAREELETFLVERPDHVPALTCLGECLVRLQDLDAAAATLDRALVQAPRDGEALVARAAVHVQQGHPERALPLLVEAERGGAGRRATLQHASCLYQTGRLSAASNLLSRLLMADPRLSAARELLALVFVRQGRFREAHDQLTRVGRRGPTGRRCHRYAAIIRRVLGGALVAENADAYFAALSLPPSAVAEREALLTKASSVGGFPDALIELAAMRTGTRRAEAVDLLRRAVAACGPVEQGASTPVALAWFRLGLLLHDEGAVDEAIDALARSAAAEPSNPEAHVRLGTLYAERGHHDDAERHLRRAIQLSPADPRPYARLAGLLAHRHDDEGAAAYRREADLLGASRIP